ncbi:MAG: sodium/glutamate symporter [Proteobacteria bacterium]|nr:sodium/glutamate symporter [Pseudomonadota bacterium]
MSLPAVPSLLAACLVLLVGDLLARRVPLLARFSIPAPIVGGLLFALGALLVGRLWSGTVTFDSSAKSTFLLLFFASVGLTADLALLRKGSRRLLRFLAALFPFLVAQNALGLLMAVVLGLHPVLGLVAGSITLVGGHGTGAAYAERFAQDFGLLNVMGLTMTSATLGLVIGGIIGGPVAERLMRRHRLEGPVDDGKGDGDAVVGPQRTPITTSSYIAALAAGLAAVVVGQAIATALEGAPVTVPSFLWCLLAGLVLRNGGGALGLRLHDASAELIGSACLSLFLVWTMMTLDIASVAAVAGPLLLILVAQAVLVMLWSTFVVFRLAGRDYEAAVTSAAFCGFAMGATATAIANMQALTRRHGSAPESAVVVPLVGAFFVDLMNLAVLTFFLLPGFIVGR